MNEIKACRSMSENHIRVVHVALQLQVGGMEKLLVEFARYVDRQQFELLFVSLGERGSLAEDIEACGWPVVALQGREGLSAKLLWRLVRVFRSWNADIVHTHNSKPLVYAGPAARLAGIKRVVHTRHGQRYQAGSRATKLFRFAARFADRVVSVSKDSARLSALEGIPADKISTVWNGIDISKFEYVGPKDGGPAAMVGRLSPEKDVETLIRAVPLVLRHHPHFLLLIAGDGPCRTDLQPLAASLGVVDHVRFLGEVRDVAGLLAGSSMFVLPSLTEGISLTLLEAMARGLPVIATRVGGNPEVVVEGETGFLVPTRSPVDLAEAILKLIGDPQQGRSMGLAGRTRVERDFDVRRMVAEYESLYLELHEPALAADRTQRVALGAGKIR
jgi:glycosyltransferase involved in cell wall biosynthesis